MNFLGTINFALFYGVPCLSILGIRRLQIGLIYGTHYAKKMTENEFNQESGMTEKQQNDTTHFEVQLNSEQLDLVQRAFTQLIENEKDIEWWDDHTLAPLDDLKHVTTKLNCVETDANGKATVPMNFREWVAFTSYVKYASKHNPNEEDRFSLEDIVDFNTDLEDRGLVPF